MFDTSHLPFDAFMIDIDDCLTRMPDRGAYSVGMHAAIVELCAEQNKPCALSLADYLHQHEGMFQAGECFHSTMADLYGLDVVALFDRMHEKIDETDIEHDTASGAALRQLAGLGMPLVKLTDGGKYWADRRTSLIGSNLRIVTRRAEDRLRVRKAHGPEMWLAGEATITDIAGHPIPRHRIAMLDDSAHSLHRGKQEGFGTVQIHYAFPGREPNPEFDFNANSVAGFIYDAGYLPRPIGSIATAPVAAFG